MTLKQSLSELERKFMPQIAHNELPQAISLLRGNGVAVKVEARSPDDLVHSQRAVNKDKVRNIIKDIKNKKQMPPIIISEDDFVIDGHHRWIAYKLLKLPIKCIRIGLPQKEAIIEFKKIKGQLK